MKKVSPGNAVAQLFFQSLGLVALLWPLVIHRRDSCAQCKPDCPRRCDFDAHQGTWLTQHGVAAARLTAKGYGKTQPVADNNSDEGRMRNRRVEIADPKCKPAAK
jgi:hypothetical protein